MNTRAEEGGASADALLGSFAHELRGPLNVCVMWLDLLELKAGQPAEVHKAAEVMRRNLAQQAVLLRELDDLGRMLGGGIELELRDADLAAILGRAAQAWRSVAAERGLDLAVRVPPSGCVLKADPERVLQACGYWVDNAIAATPPGGRIELELRRSAAGTEAEIVIKDTGVGLDRNGVERFFTAPLEGPRRQKAHGLRVVLAKHLIARHGGAVTLVSDGTGSGCTWTASVPLKR